MADAIEARNFLIEEGTLVPESPTNVPSKLPQFVQDDSRGNVCLR
jgi:hypothetical protein